MKFERGKREGARDALFCSWRRDRRLFNPLKSTIAVDQALLPKIGGTRATFGLGTGLGIENRWGRKPVARATAKSMPMPMPIPRGQSKAAPNNHGVSPADIFKRLGALPANGRPSQLLLGDTHASALINAYSLALSALAVAAGSLPFFPGLGNPGESNCRCRL
jgi:hypothetical protein